MNKKTQKMTVPSIKDLTSNNIKPTTPSKIMPNKKASLEDKVECYIPHLTPGLNSIDTKKGKALYEFWVKKENYDLPLRGIKSKSLSRSEEEMEAKVPKTYDHILNNLHGLGIGKLLGEYLKSNKNVIYQSNTKTWLWLYKDTNLYIEAVEELINPLVFEELRWFVRYLSRWAESDEVAELSTLINNTTVKDALESIRGCVTVDRLLENKPKATLVFSDGVAYDIINKKVIEVKKEWYCRVTDSKYLKDSQSIIKANPDDAVKWKTSLNHMLGKYGSKTFQKLLGATIYSSNRSKKIVILEGEADSGKSKVLSMIGDLFGERTHGGSLRLKYLSSRFELAFVHESSMIVCPDVDQQPLINGGADNLKALVGGDMLRAERKGSNDKIIFKGEKHLFITTNFTLMFPVDGDRDAWKTRLVRLICQAVKVKDENWDKKVLSSEANEIIAWVMEGARMYHDDITKLGKVKLTKTQEELVEDLLTEEKDLVVTPQGSCDWAKFCDYLEVVHDYKEGTSIKNLHDFHKGIGGELSIKKLAGHISTKFGVSKNTRISGFPPAKVYKVRIKGQL